MKIGSRAKLWQNIVVVILVGVVPMVAITLGVITISINKDISFGKWETCGIVYQRPLESLLDAVPRYNDACKRNDGGDIQAVAQEIDTAFVSLDAAQKQLGGKLQFTDAGLASRKRQAAGCNALKNEWATLKSQPADKTASGTGIDELATNVRMAIAHLGDTSNLILDPDLDSYYLMDITLCALPQTQERTGRIVAQVQDWMASGTIASHRPELTAMAALFEESDLGRIGGDEQTVINEDPNFYGTSPSLQEKLPVSLKAYMDANNALLEALKQLAAGTSTLTAKEFSEIGWKAHSQAYTFWKASSDELEILLRTRIDAYAYKRTISLLCIALALCISSLVTYWFIRKLQRTLNDLSHNLGDNAKQLVEIAGEITASSKTLADSASEQATSVEETSASLEELAGMSKNNADSATSVTSLVKDTKLAAENGEREMSGLASAMTSLQTSSKDIAQIVRTIDEIAFQTNILALNAAVEAARAGETGAGFAVVADEVRSLAQRSAKAAKETSSQIESAISNAEKGAAISAKVCDILRDIAARVRQIDESAVQVASSSKEQNMGVRQISSAIVQIDNATQKNAASAEESASVAVELDNQARHLEATVTTLAIMV
jgi:hypothetical protein